MFSLHKLAKLNLRRRWTHVLRGRAVVASLIGASMSLDAALDVPIVVTQVPRQMRTAADDWNAHPLVRADWFDGARLVLLAPNGEVRVLSSGFHSACDPCVSFDGQELLFAAKQTAEGRWRIWRMGLDGQNLRAVTGENVDARSPIYVSTLFTLDSPEPWFTTVFVGREGARAVAASSLYNIKLDGTELRRLTFSPNHAFDPFQMWDGRVLYSSECHPNAAGDREGHVGLFAIHVEGADVELYGGDTGGRVQHMGCATDRGLIVFVEPDEPTPDGAGQLACLDERRPHATYKRLTQDEAQLYLYPSAWRNNVILVSQRPVAGGGTCGLFLMDLDRRPSELIYDSPDYHEIQAAVAQVRKQPDGHSTVVNPKHNTGTFYGLDCYSADPMREAHLKPGSVKRVRFIEGVTAPATLGSDGDRRSLSPPRRLVGEAPVETDGSFNVEVPADTPLLLQTLDERGLALGTCGWIWVKPKETRGCIGCHEDPERIPENLYVLALRRPSNRLTLAPEQRRTVAFRESIAPTLKTHCATADCHGGTETPLRLPLAGEPPSTSNLQAAYAALMAPAESTPGGPLPPAGRYVDAGRARTSWLIWQLTGTNTTRPWDLAENPKEDRRVKVKQMPPAGKNSPLDPEELRTVVQWVDIGAPYEAPVPPASQRQTGSQ